jgi:Gametolysin peptidase M11
MRTLTALVSLLACLAVASAALALNGSHARADGTLETWHGDTFGPRPVFGQGVDVGKAGVVPVQMDTAAAGRLAGKRVSVQGTMRGSTLVAEAGGVQQTGGSVVAAATGSKRIAVLLVNFTNDASQPWTTSTVRGVVFDNTNSVAAYYQDASYGQLSLTGDVYGWFTIPDDNAGCDYSGWGGLARTAAANAGVDLASYTNVVYAWPSASSCAWAGLAYLPGRDSFVNGSMNLRVVGHELGHNFGVHHASTLNCTSGGTRVTFGGTCSADEYGDPFTIMGSASTYHHDNWQRAQLGWMSMQTVSTGGTYSLAPAETSSTGVPRLLRIARGDGTYLNLEFRRPGGTFETFSSSSAVANGVSIRIAPETSSLVQSKLLDATPATSTFTDAALPVGSSFTDPLSNATISTVSVSSTGATVSIEFGTPPSDTTPPGAPGSLTATATSSTSVSLAWTASTDNVGVTGYRVLRNGVQIGTPSGLSYSDGGRSPNTAYAYEVRAVDAAGNVGQGATASVTTPPSSDVSAPSPTPVLSATVAKGRRVDLRWTASQDPGGVTYRVTRNGSAIATTTGLGSTDRPGRGTFTYAVEAFDAFGNTVASNAAQVTT